MKGKSMWTFLLVGGVFLKSLESADWVESAFHSICPHKIHVHFTYDAIC